MGTHRIDGHAHKARKSIVTVVTMDLRSFLHVGIDMSVALTEYIGLYVTLGVRFYSFSDSPAMATHRVRGIDARTRGIPSNLKSLCILARGQPKLARQIIARADPTLVRSFSECAKNILHGNLPITLAQKKKLRKYARPLRTLSQKTGSVKNKKALLMKGGLLGIFARTVDGILKSINPKWRDP
jgi:hypothetical protein